LGGQGIVALNELDQFNVMERISKVEFEKELFTLREGNGVKVIENLVTLRSLS